MVKSEVVDWSFDMYRFDAGLSEYVYKPFLMVSSLDYLYEFVWESTLIDRHRLNECALNFGLHDFNYSVRLTDHNVIRRSNKLRAVALITGVYGMFVFHYTSRVTLPPYVRTVLYASAVHERGLCLLYVVALLSPGYVFELSRSSADADIETNPGPTVLSNNEIVSATVVITAVPLLGFLLSWEIFLLWIVFVVCMVVYYPAPGTERSFYRKYRTFVIPFFLSLTVVIGNYVAQFKLARNSTQHDIELNPGPGSWLDDPERNNLLSGMGTLLHQYDVRSVLITSGVHSSVLDAQCQLYVCADACAKYYRSLYPRGDFLLVPSGVSSHAVAKAFRAVYPFLRDGYVKYLQQEFPTSSLLVSNVGSFPVCDRIHRSSHGSEKFGTVTVAGDDVVATYRDLEKRLASIELLEQRTDDFIRVMSESSADRKVFCDACQCNVNPDGHDKRCRPIKQPVPGQERVAAWIGDAIHTLDVRIALVRALIPEKRLSILCDTFKSASAQADYIRANATALGLDLDLAESDRRLSTGFEAGYGRFRSKYISKLVEDVEDIAAGEGVSSYAVASIFTSFNLLDLSFYDLL